MVRLSLGASLGGTGEKALSLVISREHAGAASLWHVASTPVDP
jgi:hypothetical protein